MENLYLMKNILKTTLLFGSLVVSPMFANAQGMGAIVENPNCRPTTIKGEHNPTPGQLYTYEHDYEIANGEQFTWEVEGATEVDGSPATLNGKTTVTKGGKGIDVIWDGEHPINKIKVSPATNCAGLAQINGGLGSILVVNPVMPVSCAITPPAGFTGAMGTYSQDVNTSTCTSCSGSGSDYTATLATLTDEVSRTWYASYASWNSSFTGGTGTSETLFLANAGDQIFCDVTTDDGMGLVCNHTFVWNMVLDPAISAGSLNIMLEPCDENGVMIIEQFQTPLCGGPDYTREVEVVSGPAVIDPSFFYNGQDPNGIVYDTYLPANPYNDWTLTGMFALHPNGATSIDVRTRIGHQSCGWSAWSYETLTITPQANDGFTDITYTGTDFCGDGSGQKNFTAISNTTYDTYEWTITSNAGLNYTDYTYNNNQWNYTIPVSMASEFTVEVKAMLANACGYQPIYSETFTTAQGIALTTPSISPNPFSVYCKGLNNTFEETNNLASAVYSWIFIDQDGNVQTASGIGMNTFTPDFGDYRRSGSGYYTQYPGSGTVTSYTLTVVVSNCDGEVTSTISDNTINYGGIGSRCAPYHESPTPPTNPNDGKEFTIDLLPNPAQNHVNVKFPSGGNSKNIRVIDAYGTERKNVNTTSASEMINISDLPLGTYTVIATEDGEIATEHLQVLP